MVIYLPEYVIAIVDVFYMPGDVLKAQECSEIAKELGGALYGRESPSEYRPSVWLAFGFSTAGAADVAFDAFRAIEGVHVEGPDPA